MARQFVTALLLMQSAFILVALRALLTPRGQPVPVRLRGRPFGGAGRADRRPLRS